MNMKHKNNLPKILTDFIGKKTDVEEVKQRLTTSRLITLTGESGIGKTRLALEVAAQMTDQFTDGVWYVDLAHLIESAFLPQTVGQALGIREKLNNPLVETIAEALELRYLLVILDHCDHFLKETGRLVSQLLGDAPELRIIATSREPLNIPGETAIRVQPLETPAEDAINLHNISSTSVRLFVDRARQVAPTFSLTYHNMPVIAQICRLLEGLPLAIELAAARMNIQVLINIPTGLSDHIYSQASVRRLPFLHHSVLNAAIDWSYSLLSETEQMLFRRLTIFPGSWTIEAAVPICVFGLDEHPIKAENFQKLLHHLISCSFLTTIDQHPIRFRLPEAVRQYGLARLRESDENEAIRAFYIEFFVNLAHEADPLLLTADQLAWHDRIQDEMPNFRNAFEWSRANGQVEKSLLLTSSLKNFWIRNGHFSEGQVWLEKVLSDQESVPAARSTALNVLGDLERIQGKISQARSHLEESLKLSLESESFESLAEAQLLLAMVAGEQGNLAEAQELVKQSLAGFRKLGSNHGIILSLKAMGDIARALKDYSGAETIYQEGLTRAIDNNDLCHTGSLLNDLGHVSKRRDDFAQAQIRLREALMISEKNDDPWHSVPAMAGLAGLTLARGNPERAAKMFGAVQQLLDSLGSYLEFADRLDYEQDLEVLHTQMTESSLRDALEGGQILTVEQATSYALSGTDVSAPIYPKGISIHYGGLTIRERQVARLIAQGKSNAEIAAKLFIENRTVEIHINHIFSKLGFASRGEIIHWVNENGLVPQRPLA
jgi:predicted ATPase/DNA-binding CsgD family transcriptional regulator